MKQKTLAVALLLFSSMIAGLSAGCSSHNEAARAPAPVAPESVRGKVQAPDAGNQYSQQMQIAQTQAQQMQQAHAAQRGTK